SQIIRIDVWQSVPNPLQNRKVVQGHAYIDLPNHPPNQKYDASIEDSLNKAPGRYEEGYFLQLDPTKDYKFVGDRQQFGGYIIMNTNVTDDQVLAVTYTILGGTEPRIYGSADVNDTTAGGKLLLKLVKPKFLSQNPNYKPAWDLQLKNIYPLGGRDLKREGFILKAYRRTQGTEVEQIGTGQYLINVLGLDRFNKDNNPTPDNEFDFLPGLTIDVDRAEVIFPTLRPYDSTIVRYFRNSNPSQVADDSLLFSAVYDTTVTAAQNDLVKNKYFLRVTSSSAVSSRYSLGFNVVEGSVHVLLGGTELIANTDYTVDYIVGEVVIRRPEALLPGANVQIKFEQNDLFQLASKTLMGARGELNLFPNTSLGFTAMNLNQATLSDKVRLGEEPTSNLMLGVDGATSFNLPFLTSALDALPFFRTREMSTIRISAEAAYSLPDPNTKKSTLPSDNNVSVAYLDDFEGARRTIPIDLNFANWRFASPPVYSLLGQNIDDTTKVFSKSRLWWYNNFNGFENTIITDIWPNRSVRRGQEFTQVLYLDYDPNHRGMYNYSLHLDSTLHRASIGQNTGTFDDAAERRKNWNGIMRYIAPFAGSILDQNVSYLELWMQVYDRGDPNFVDSTDRQTGKLYIDLGRISEDVISNKKLNSEDIIPTSTNPQGIPHGVVNDENDFGLDMRSDAEERSDQATFLTTNIHGGVLDPDIDPNDPAGDDFFYQQSSNNFAKFNGPEGNFKGNASNGRFPNTEDLNNNGTVDLENQYVEYEVPVGARYIDSTSTVVNNPLIVGGNPSKGWYQFRIPLLQANRLINGTSIQSILQNVQYIRMWVSGFANPVVLRIAEIDLVGNQWQELTRNDSLMKISVVNFEDNPEYNTPDYQRLGIGRERDKTQPDQVILANEQSLSLILNGLPLDSSRQAVKYFPVRPLDVFNYKSMKMFVHGEASFSYVDTNNYDARIFLRFGADTVNYYEYSQPVHPGWDPANEISISFAELTAIKATRDSVNSLYRVPVLNGPPTATYGVRGNPSLRQIRYIGIGISNPRLSGKLNTLPLRGQVWVNELRLVDVDNASGYAYRFDTQIKLADFGSVSFNFNRISPTFHGLEQRFGDQNDRTNWGMSSSADLTKFFPDSWQGTSASISYSHSENLVKPKYLPNTDVVVAEAANRAAAGTSTVTPDKIITESQSLHVQDSYALTNLRIAPPIQAWYIRDTFSKLSFGFNYNSSRDRDPATVVRRVWGWNASANYAVTLPSDYYVQPFKNIFSGIFLLKEFKDWKFYYIPFTNISASIGATRSRTYEVSRFFGSIPRDTRNLSVGKRFGFGWKLTEGGLTGLAGDYGLSMDRSLINFDNDSVGRDFTSMLKTILFRGTDSRYSQRVTFNLKPKIPNIFDINKFLDLTATYGVNYGWQNTFQQGDLGKSAGFDNTISLGLGLRLKSLTDPWFQQSAEEPQSAPEPPPENSKKAAGSDSTASKEVKKPEQRGNSRNLLNNLKSVAKLLIKIPFFDYENINISFSQNNRAANSGIIGSTGFLNFWRFPWQSSLIENGPSRLYQLGIIS
ncbi:MAG: cell surface protein SprA, partial [Ignavibacteriales bacterium]|nr:cell surface protein SprA [Ignavibacteriales bacterium]